MNRTEHELELMRRYLNGAASLEETQELESLIVNDASMRQEFLRYTHLDSALAGVRRSQPSVVAPRRSVWLSWHPRIAAAAALVIFAAAGAWIWFVSREFPVLTLVDASGPIAWSEDGKWRSDLTVGEQLTAGTIETIGESATASFRFRDGTLVTLSGDSELSFSESGQKLLLLRKGSLSAQVKPQSKDKPMLVRTSSAEAQVVGTAFNLATRTEDTLLKVDEGLVKLRRLADGSMIDVPAKSSAVASLDSGLKLNSATTPEPLADWSFDFTNTQAPRDWRGVSDGTRMIASPYVASRMASGAIVTHFGISVRTAQLIPPLSLLVTEKSVIRYRLRQNQIKPLQIMLLTSKTSGGYGGNFEARLDPSELKPNTDGWCDVAVPVSAFKALSPRHASPIGNLVTSALISSLQSDTKLTIARFELKSEP